MRRAITVFLCSAVLVSAGLINPPAQAESSTAKLVEDAPAATSGSLKISSLEGFSTSGAWGFINPDSYLLELFYYAGAADSSLSDVTRPRAQAHKSGTPVVPVSLEELDHTHRGSGSSYLYTEVKAANPEAPIEVYEVEPFNSAGGWALMDPGTGIAELFYYSALETEGTRLVGVIRPTAGDHAPAAAIVPLQLSPQPRLEPEVSRENREPNNAEARQGRRGGREGNGGKPEDRKKPREDRRRPGQDQAGVGSGEAPGPVVVIRPRGTRTRLGLPVVSPSPSPSCSPPSSPSPATTPSPSSTPSNCSGDGGTQPETSVSENGAEAAAAPPCTGAPKDCASELITLVTQLIEDLCPNLECSQDAIDLIRELAAQAIETVADLNSIIDDFCSRALPEGPSPVYGSEGVPPCAMTALRLVGTGMEAICHSVDAGTCVQYLNQLLANTCGLLLANGPFPSAGDVIVDAHPCIRAVLSQVGNAMDTVCHSADAETCIAYVDLMLANACELLFANGPVPSLPGVVGNAPPCVKALLGQVGNAMETACESADVVTCFQNVNQLLGTVCGEVLPQGTIPSVTGAVDETHPCVKVVLGQVGTAMEAACESANVETCVENLNQLAETVCGETLTQGPIPSGTGLIGDAHPCLKFVLGAVGAVMELACGSAHVPTCQENLDQLITTACGVLIEPGTPPEGTDLIWSVHPCVEAALGQIGDAMIVVCDASEFGLCAENLVSMVNERVANTCNSLSGGPLPEGTSGLASLHTCAATVLGQVGAFMKEICQSTQTAKCLDNAANSSDQTLEQIVRTAWEAYGSPPLPGTPEPFVIPGVIVDSTLIAPEDIPSRSSEELLEKGVVCNIYAVPNGDWDKAFFDNNMHEWASMDAYNHAPIDGPPDPKCNRRTAEIEVFASVWDFGGPFSSTHVAQSEDSGGGSEQSVFVEQYVCGICGWPPWEYHAFGSRLEWKWRVTAYTDTRTYGKTGTPVRQSIFAQKR